MVWCWMLESGGALYVDVWRVIDVIWNLGPLFRSSLMIALPTFPPAWGLLVLRFVYLCGGREYTENRDLFQFHHMKL